MLADCLASVVDQSAPPSGWDWKVLVVENDERGECMDIASADRLWPCHVSYVLEPRLGIPFARNAAVEEALRHGADWIAFIDDDETISPDWLQQMIAAIERYKADVIAAPVQFQCDDPDALWIQEAPEIREGTSLSTAKTGNVAFRRKLVEPRPVGYELRFNEERRFSGGEDVDFFRRATRLGAQIVWTNGAVAVERQVHGNRLTFRWYFARMSAYAANVVADHASEDGYGVAVKAFGLKGVRMVLGPSFRIIVLAGLWRLKGRDHFRRRLKKKATQIALGTGYLRGLAGANSKRYAAVDGS